MSIRRRKYAKYKSYKKRMWNCPFTIFIFLCSCTGSVSVVQRGWDKYAGNMKSALEGNLVLEYAHDIDQRVNTVYYFGKYGRYSGSKSDPTSFYFAYSVKDDFTYNIDEYTYEARKSSAKGEKGILINNAIEYNNFLQIGCFK